MNAEQSIFRPEAVAHRQSRGGPGDVLRAAPGWTRWFFWVLIALVVVALVAACLVEVNRYARGPTSVAGGRVVVLVPAAIAPRVAAGNMVEVGEAIGTVVSSGNDVLYPNDVAQKYGVEVTSPSTEITTDLDPAEAAGGAARVLVESGPVIVQFVPGLDSLLGGD